MVYIPHHAGWYGSGCAMLVVLVFLLTPDPTLRLHHYVVAQMLFPGTASHKRSSVIYKAFLLGLFVNGGEALKISSGTRSCRRQD